MNFLKRHNFLLIFFFTLLLYTFPLLRFRFLPFVDLPQHLYFTQIFLNFNNPLYQNAYEMKLFPNHNIIYLLFAYILSPISSAALSLRIFIILSVILLPLSVLYLLRSLRGNKWIALLSFLFIYNFNLFWGFIGFVFALPIIVIIIALHEHSLQREDLKLRIITGLLFILTFCAHALTYLFSFLLYLGCFFVRWKRIKGRLLRFLLPLIPSLFFSLPWLYHQLKKEGAGTTLSLFSFSGKEVLTRIINFLNFLGVQNNNLYKFSIVGFLCLLGYSVYRLLKSKKILQQPSVILSLSLILISLLLYFFLPYQIGTANILNQRFAICVLLFSIPLISLVIYRHRLIHILLLGVVLLNGIDTIIRFQRFNDEAEPVTQVFEGLKAGKIMVMLPYTRESSSIAGYPVFLHFPCYYAARYNGFVGFSLAHHHYFPIHYKFPPLLPWINEWNPPSFLFPDNWIIYDYFLVYQEPPNFSEYAKEWRLLNRAEKWTLYENPVKREIAEATTKVINKIGLAQYRRLFVPPDNEVIAGLRETIKEPQKIIDYRQGSIRLTEGKESEEDFFPALALWLLKDQRPYLEMFNHLNSLTNFIFGNLQFTLLAITENNRGAIYEITRLSP